MGLAFARRLPPDGIPMRQPPLRCHTLCRALTASACLGAFAGAAAQDNPPPPTTEPEVPAGEVQTVQITGARASLERSINLKRNAATVQDSITALELGRFPDDNVADSLGHITGVAIKRTAGGEG